MDVRLLGKKNVGEGLGVAVLVDSAFAELKDKSDEQLAEAQRFLIDFMKKVARLKGARIDRPHFLRSELRRKGVHKDVVEFAVETTPVTAGIDVGLIDRIAREVIDFEAKKSTAFSFAAGLPGGVAMVGTIPADITQYYVHAFRIMQQLAYLYGWQTFFEECDDVDDETLYEMAVLLGVMMGVGSANSMLTVIAKNAQEAVAKKVARQSLTKTSWYPILKKLLSFMGIKITKQTVGDAAGKVVVGVGGVISGAITFMGLSKGSARLCRQLKCLPQANERIPGTGYYEKDEAAVAKKRIDEAEPLFIEKFGFTPMFYGSIVEYADRLEESLATGEAKLDAYNPDVLL